MNFKLFIFLVLLLTACKTSSNEETQAKVPSEAKDQISYAKHLRIQKERDLVRIEILHPENGKATFKAILSKSKPKDILSGYSFIQIPVNDLAVLSATQIGMLSKLNEVSRISAVSSKKYIYNPTILRSIDEGKVKDLGDESLIPAESIISSGSKFLFYSDFGQAFPHTEQLQKIGITVIPNPDWREIHPLGKAEWIKLFGYLTGKEHEAISIFKQTEKEYLRLSKIAKEQTNKPSLISGNMLGDIWWAPSGESYNSTLFGDAGGNYVYSKTKGTGSIERTVEQIIDQNVTTKFWFNPGMNTKNEILSNSPKLKYLKLINSNNIYCYSHRMNFYWEMSAIEPHRVLEDLIRILHPEALPEGKLYFYKEVN
jgi:iron complex transport system substrate-binding protein